MTSLLVMLSVAVVPLLSLLVDLYLLDAARTRHAVFAIAQASQDDLG